MNKISYSQFKKYLECPKAWENKYVRKISKFSGSIHTVFGSAMHTVVEEWVKTIYNMSAKKANELNLNSMLKKNLKIEYSKSKILNENKDFSTAKDLAEFYRDGVEILNFLKKKRGRYFPKKNMELIDIELELDTDLKNSIKFKGFIDIILKDKLRNKVIIIDIKTSTRTWQKEKKQNDLVRMQLAMYKHYYARQFNIDVKDIEVLFLILKRKLYENCDYTQSRIQQYEPPSSQRTIDKYLKKIDKFIIECFDENGNYIDKDYEAIGSPTICKWCEYHLTEYCPKLGNIK
jgi:RecB family exonuclease